MSIQLLNNKKKLAYIGTAIVASLFIYLGFPISNAILNNAEENARKYQTAIQIKDDGQLNYSIDTKQGYLLAYVTVSKVDEVKFPEMNKAFAYAKKTKERYTRHEREVCETYHRSETNTRTVYDSEGNASTETYTEEVPYEECHTEEYWTWDYQESWEETAKEVSVAGRKYPYSLFNIKTQSIDASEIINGANGHYVYERTKGGIFGRAWLSSDTEGDIRYSYSIANLPQAGTIFADTTSYFKPVYGASFALHGQSAESMVEGAVNAAQTQKTVFIVLWSILILGIIIGGCVLAYRLEDFI